MTARTSVNLRAIAARLLELAGAADLSQIAQDSRRLESIADEVGRLESIVAKIAGDDGGWIDSFCIDVRPRPELTDDELELLKGPLQT